MLVCIIHEIKPFKRDIFKNSYKATVLIKISIFMSPVAELINNWN